LSKRLLNVGGGRKTIPLPSCYSGWEHLLLDIHPGPDVDLVLDARRLRETGAAEFDAVYCSHNLEHYHPHEVPLVLRGFQHVLKADGFAHIIVPDVGQVVRYVAANNMELDDVLYQSQAGPITAHDVIYGYGREMERSGRDFYAHKRGFTLKSLTEVLGNTGFATAVFNHQNQPWALVVLAFKQTPNAEQKAMFGLGGAAP
jgi:hypothetical protein